MKEYIKPDLDLIFFQTEFICNTDLSKGDWDEGLED